MVMYLYLIYAFIGGVLPGLYWQLMWRYISPTFMATVIMSSTYFMLINKPVYTAWNKTMVSQCQTILYM